MTAWRARSGRAFRGTAQALVLVVTFVASAVLAVAMHVDTPAAKRVAVTETNLLLKTLFHGEVRIEHIGHLSLRGVRDARVLVNDPAAARVIEADGVSARIETWRLLRSLVARSGPIDVRVYDASARRIDVSLAQTDGGGLRIAQAFERPTTTVAGTPPRAVRFELDVVAVGVHVKDAPRDFELTGDLRGHMTVVDGVIRANAVLGGNVSEVPLAFDGSIDGDRVDAVLTLGKFDARRLARLSEVTLRGTASARVEVHGTLARLAVTAHAGLDEASVDVTGELLRGVDTTATFKAVVARLDASAIIVDAPVTSIDATVDAVVTQKPVGLSGSVNAVVTRAIITGEPLPSASLVGTFDETGGSGTLVVDEPGAHADATLVATRVGTKLVFDLRVHAPDLTQIERLGGRARGAVDAHVKGELALDARQLDVAVDAQAVGLATDQLYVGRAALAARVRGAFAGPSVEGRIDVTGLRAAGFSVTRGSVRASGPIRRPRLTVDMDGPASTHLEAGAVVAMVLPIDIRDAFVRVSRGNAHISAKVAEVRIDGSDVRVAGAVVEGMGQPAKIDLEKIGPTLHLRVDAPGLDLGRLATVSESSVAFDGLLKVDADLTVTAGVARGKIKLDAQHVRARELHDVDAHVDVAIDGRRLSGNATVTIPDVVNLHANAPDVVLAGDFTQAASWTHAKGHADVAGDVALDRVLAFFPEGMLPLTELRGKLALTATATHDARHAEPTVLFRGTTHGLVAVAPKWSSTGVDVDLGVRLEAETDALDVTVQLRDAGGVLANAWASAKLRDLRTMPFEHVPLRARVALEAREVGALPPAVRPKSIRGAVDALLVTEGPLLSPRAALTVHGRHLIVVPDQGIDPTDIDVVAQYDGKQANIDLGASGHHGQTLHAVAELRVHVSDLLGGDFASLPWNASARATLAGFELESIPAIADYRVAGLVHGEVSIDDFHADARANVSLELDNVRVGRVRKAKGKLRAALDPKSVTVLASLDHGDGSVIVEGSSIMRWGAALYPRFDASQPAVVGIHARTLRAALFAPFVGESFRDLDGRISADLRGTLGPIGHAPTVVGTVELKDGNVNVPAFGQELQGITARIVATQDGVVTLDHASARALGGTVEANARAQIHGLSFVNGTGTLQVAQGTPVPITVDGEPLGDVWGRIDITASQTAAALVADVSVPTLHVRMSDVARSAAQSLAPARGVRVGVRIGDGSLAPIGTDLAPEPAKTAPFPVRVTVKLGNDVEIRRGTMLRVALRGGPTIEMTDKLRVTGQIFLVNGTLDVQGKRFQFENGTVTFVGDDPTDPTLVVTATWDAPEGTRIFADFVGPLKSGKLTLRSEPALGQNEILALILFGSTDGLQGQGSTPADPGNAALGAGAGVGGGLATQGVNKAISQLTTVDISTRVDTAHDNPRPEVVVQLTKSISAQFAYVLGTPPIGQNPDQTLLTINWRFLGKWSLETTVGDAGSSIMDVLWVHRY